MYWVWMKYFYEFEFTKEPFMLVQLIDPHEAIRYAVGVYQAERAMDDPRKDWGSSISVKLQDVDSGDMLDLYRYDVNTQDILKLEEPSNESQT